MLVLMSKNMCIHYVELCSWQCTEEARQTGLDDSVCRKLQLILSSIFISVRMRIIPLQVNLKTMQTTMDVYIKVKGIQPKLYVGGPLCMLYVSVFL